MDRIPGPGRRAGTKHQAVLDRIGQKAEVLWARWGSTRLEPDDVAGRSALQKDLSDFHEEWQEVAREEVHFMTGCGMSGEVGKALVYEEVHPASLVIGRGCGKPKFFRCTATRWCVRRLQEAANGWAPTGEKWWDNWVERLETWVQDDLLRARHKVLFKQVWAHWEDLAELAKQARVALDIFVPLLKADEMDQVQGSCCER